MVAFDVPIQAPSSEKKEALPRLRQASTAAEVLTRTGSLSRAKSKREVLKKRQDEVTAELQTIMMQLPGSVDAEVCHHHSSLHANAST